MFIQSMSKITRNFKEVIPYVMFVSAMGILGSSIFPRDTLIRQDYSYPPPAQSTPSLS